MKITKSYLKEIIKEELEQVSEQQAAEELKTFTTEEIKRISERWGKALSYIQEAQIKLTPVLNKMKDSTIHTDLAWVENNLTNAMRELSDRKQLLKIK